MQKVNMRIQNSTIESVSNQSRIRSVEEAYDCDQCSFKLVIDTTSEQNHRKRALSPTNTVFV